jgi:UDP-glucose 4-epimerase
MDLSSKNILVTGGAGFIGSHLVEALLAEKCRVTVLDNLSSGRLSNLEAVKDRIRFHQGDIQDQQLVLDLSKNCELIFHLAAEVSVPRTIENPLESAKVNEIGTISVLEAARRNRITRLVFSSSCAVYGEGVPDPKTERMEPEPLSPYAVQKLTGEFYAGLYRRLYGLETVCLRYFNVYGPRQDPSSPYSGVISIFLDRAVAAKQPIIYGDGNQYRDFVFVKDVVRANLLAATATKVGEQVFNIGTGQFVRINQLWNVVQKLSGISIEPDFRPMRPGDIQESVANIDRARSVLGFRPAHELEKALQKTLDWYRRQKRSL